MKRVSDNKPQPRTSTDTAVYGSAWQIWVLSFHQLCVRHTLWLRSSWM